MLLISSNSIASYVFCKDYLAAFFMLSSPVLVFSVNQQLNTEALRALGKTRLYSLFIFLPSLFNFFLLAVFTFIFFDPNLPVYLYLLVPIIISPLSLFAVKKCFGGTNSLGCHRVESFSTLLNLSFPMFVTSFLVLIISQADFVLLGIFATEKEVGIYHVVIKLASMTSFVLMSINSILAPKFSELYYGKKLLELKSIGVAATKLAVLISTPILFMTLLFGKWLLSLFGQEFVIGFSALAIVVFGQFVHTITGSVGYFLNMSGHQRQLRNLMVLSAILSVMLNLTLIPKYGILGSAVANTSAVIFWNISGSIYMKRKYGFALSYIPFVFKKSGN
jgi:O-antigen/teichoic acid export membrane protein